MERTHAHLRLIEYPDGTRQLDLLVWHERRTCVRPAPSAAADVVVPMPAPVPDASEAAAALSEYVRACEAGERSPRLERACEAGSTVRPRALGALRVAS